MLSNAPRVLALYEEFKADPHLDETLNEIALVRAKLGSWLQDFGATSHPQTVELVRRVSDTISGMVERRHKMLYGEQVTVRTEDFKAMVSGVIEVARRVYGDQDERWAKFRRELEHVIGRADGSDSQPGSGG